MKKGAKSFFLLCGICFIITACKPTTSHTEEAKKTYKELIDSIDLDKGTLSLELSDMVHIDAIVTPKSKYENGLGIYEFESEAMSFDIRGFIDRLNQYFGREEVLYEESAEYLVENDIENLWRWKAGCDINLRGSIAEWRCNAEDAQDYLTSTIYLLSNRYPVYYTDSNLMEDKIKRITHLFSDQFQNIEQGEFRYIIINGEEDYKKIEDIYRHINIGLSEKETDYIFDCHVNLTPVAVERKPIYGVEVCETIGEEKIPVIFMNYASYKNHSKKPIPETSHEGMNNEIWTPVYNYICATFDNSGNLQNIFIQKYVHIKDTPERVEQILDLRQVLNIVYEKVKDVKRPVNIYSVKLGYTGVIQEEEDRLEDYIYPVWEIQYYDSSVPTTEKIHLDAVTGREL